MRKIAVFFLIVLVAGLLATTASAQPIDRYDQPPRYDRYERDYTPPPPPPRRAAPPGPVMHAAEGRIYFLGHLGLFSPNDSSDGLEGYDTGWNFDVGLGSRVTPIVAIEGMVGYFQAKDGDRKAEVVPFTVGARLIIPNPVFEPYFGAGLGIYHANLKEPSPNPVFDIDDSETTIGGYLSLGLDLWLNNRTAFNIEGKYQMVEPEFHSRAGNSFDVDMSGWSLNFGVRVDF